MAWVSNLTSSWESAVMGHKRLNRATQVVTQAPGIPWMNRVERALLAIQHKDLEHLLPCAHLGPPVSRVKLASTKLWSGFVSPALASPVTPV